MLNNDVKKQNGENNATNQIIGITVNGKLNLK